MHCRHHPTCPGCPLLDRPYPAQLAAKRSRLDRALSRYPHLGLSAPERVEPSPHPEGYRHRLKLPLDTRRRPAAIGLYDRRHRGRVLDTPDCPVLAPALREALEVLTVELSGHHEVHSLDLRVSDATGRIQAVLATDGGHLKGGKGFGRRLLDRVPGLTSLALSTADPKRRRVMGRRPTPFVGATSLTERIGDTAYTLLPGSFFQADPRHAATLHRLVREAVGDGRRILDLYSGVGAYARMLAPHADRVVAIEEVPQAARAAAEGAPPSLEVIRGRAEDVRLDEDFDVVILNPARRGADPGLLARLPGLAPRAVYISCGPETLARDLDVLAAHGLHAERITALDLFPQTHEVETVVTLTRDRPLTTWRTRGGRAGGPWRGHPSGAIGRPDEVIALVIGDPGRGGRLPGATFERLGLVASHALIDLRLRGPAGRALAALARRGHPTAGLDPRTARFFASKAGLVRPFQHTLRAGRAVAPVHGDLMQALVDLRAHPRLVERVEHLATP